MKSTSIHVVRNLKFGGEEDMIVCRVLGDDSNIIRITAHGDENHETNRSSIMEDCSQKQKETQFNQSYLMTYTQGNMTTNMHNLSITKTDLNGVQGRYKSANIPVKESIQQGEYPIDSKDAHIVEPTASDRVICEMELTANTNEKGASKNTKKKKKKLIDLQIEIPDSDEERKAQKAAKEKIKSQLLQNKDKGVDSKRTDIQSSKEKQNEQLQNKQQKQQQQQRNPSSGDNPESARVNDIIRNNQIDVENLETIQIDYDFETIEGLTDDQCLELYCEGSVKLKNSQRLHCKVAYEQLLIEKIRSTTRLTYSNLGIINNGNLNSSEFIADYIVVPLKRENSKFRTVDINEAFTVQCADYIHFNLRKNLTLSLKLLFFLSLLQLINIILKMQDPAYDTQVAIQIGSIGVGVVQIASSYYYISGIYSCHNGSIRRAIFLTKTFFVLNIIQLILEAIISSYISALLSGTINLRNNFKQIAFYFLSFLTSQCVTPYLLKINRTTTVAIRKIVNIVSDELMD